MFTERKPYQYDEKGIQHLKKINYNFSPYEKFVLISEEYIK